MNARFDPLDEYRPAGLIEPHQTRGSLRLSADVVVVGSGAGGATAAATLAEAGRRVLLLEEGPWYRTRDYGPHFASMTGEITRNGGATVIMGRSPIAYLEGRVVGGSTVLNGGMCWRTPEEVLDRWVREAKLPEYSAKALDSTFSLIESVIDARHQDPGSEGENNHVFRRGAEALGWSLQRNKRNQRHCVGSNDCVTGCPSGAKRSSKESWLPHFFRNGGELITHARVTKLRRRGGRVVGVEGSILDPLGARSLSVDARAVVIAGGAIQTPLLLQRSGLRKISPHLGAHFTVHPNVKVAARFDHPIESLRGVHQAWQCVEFQKEGLLLAPGGVPLAVITQCFPSFGAKLFQEMENATHIATGGILIDDSIE
ncbi:MAG: FAD-dependent oxidoreductase, partial [Myxococcota bacterium]|nr:FAD-dependent oxidoreductase [Myxococcota bacterium]